MQIRPYTHPAEVFKYLANKESEYEHARDPRPKIPKVEIKRIPRSVGFWYIIRQLRP